MNSTSISLSVRVERWPIAGAFTIKAVSPGTYTYRAWRPGGPMLSGTVVIQAESALDVAWP